MKDIRHVESKISVTKLKLKSKITNRLNKISTSHQIAVDAKKDIVNIYQQLAMLSFDQLTDYQELFNYLRSATTLYDLTPVGELEIINQKSANSEVEAKEILTLDNNFKNSFFWRKLYKYETKILRLAYNIVTLNLELRKKVDSYNDVSGKRRKTLPVPAIIEIEHFELLWQIISEEDKAELAAKAATISVDVPPDVTFEKAA